MDFASIRRFITIPLSFRPQFLCHIKIYQFLAQRLVYLDEVPLDENTLIIMSYHADHELWKFLDYLPWSAIDDVVQERIMVVDGKHDKSLLSWLSFPPMAFCFEIHHNVILKIQKLNGMIHKYEWLDTVPYFIGHHIITVMGTGESVERAVCQFTLHLNNPSEAYINQQLNDEFRMLLKKTKGRQLVMGLDAVISQTTKLHLQRYLLNVVNSPYVNAYVKNAYVRMQSFDASINIPKMDEKNAVTGEQLSFKI